VLSGLLAGEHAAASVVFRRFASRLALLARDRLEKRLQGKVDADDVLQSVWRTFFRRCAQAEFDLDGWDQLEKLLVCLTIRRCSVWSKHFHSRCRDIATEGPTGGDANQALTRDTLDREPTAEEAAIRGELEEELLRGLRKRDRDIVSLRLAGYTPSETASELNLPERTVFRVLTQVRDRLTQRLQDTDPDDAGPDTVGASGS
jgi:RNA polymerase sigma-70 factor (ECF subfamily)